MTEKNRGFTIIELMIVIMMIGILASIAIPQMRKWMDNNRFVGVVDHVRSSMSYAKLTALKQSTNVLVEFSAGTGGNGVFRAYVDDGGGTDVNANNKTYDAGETILAQNSMPRGVTLSSASFGAANSNALLFNPAGLPMESSAGAPTYYPGNVVIGTINKYRRVSVTAGGVIKIEKSANIGGPWIE